MNSYLLAADNHNIGNTGTSWLDLDTWTTKFGNAGKLAATSILSGTNSFYNTAATVGSWLGMDTEQRDTQAWISSIDSDLGTYYRANTETADLVGFVLGSMIPGLAGTKLFNAGQVALKTATKTGFIGGNLSKATGLLVPDTQKFVNLAAQQINASTTSLSLLNRNTVKALAAGVWQNTLESAAFEIAATATMFKSPVLSDMDIGDISANVMYGGLLGGAIGGSFQAAKTFGFLKSAVKAEDTLRLPFLSRPNFAERTGASEKIVQLAYDSDMAAMPVALRAADGTLVENNFAVTKTLYDDKIRKNFNEIRGAINSMTHGDTEIGNILANTSTPMPGSFGYAQNYFQNFSGAVEVSRVAGLTPAEIAYNKALRKGTVPERQIATRFVSLLGETAGEITDTAPVVLSLADQYAGQKKIMDVVRSKYAFTDKKMWSALDLSGSAAHTEAEARYIWANHILKEIKDDALISRYDIPLLERAYKDGKLNIKIVAGNGPDLDVVVPASQAELLAIIKESKIDVANELLRKMSLDGKLPVEQGTAAAAKIVNTKQSFLEGVHSPNEFDDLFANQALAKKYMDGIKEKGLSETVAEAKVDPIFLPKFAKVVYDKAEDLASMTENVVDAMVHYKAMQSLYQQGAKQVSARILGDLSDSLPDISDKALITANRTGSGPGLFSSENSNYGTLGSSMAWIGSITREAKARARKLLGDQLTNPLARLAAKPEAAIEFEGINQKVTRSAKQWVLAENTLGERGLVDKKIVDAARSAVDDFDGIVDFEDLIPEGPGMNWITVKNQETLDALETHIKATGSRTQSLKEIHAQQGHTDFKSPEVFRPIRPDLKQYPHFALVVDPKVTGTGHVSMIHAASEKELAELTGRVPSAYKVIHKADTEEFFKARGEYEFSRTLHENYLDGDLANRGVFSNFFPKSDPAKIVNDVLQQHMRESDMVIQDAVRLRYESQFSWLEDLGKQYSKTATSRFASRSELIEKTSNNPYFNYIKTALDISKASEHPLIYGFNKMLDGAVSKAVGAIRDTFQGVKTPADLGKINALLDEYGIKPAYYDASLHALSNHSAPRGELTKFVRSANSLLSLFVLGLDPLNAVNNAVGSNILRMTELQHLTRAIKAGNLDVAGDLGKIAKIKLPGVGDEILAPTKLVAKAVENFWRDNGDLVAKYKNLGYIKDRAEQLKLLVDDFTLQGTETVAELNKRLATGFQRAKDLAEKGESLSGNKLAEEMNRFISANVMDQITNIGVKHGLIDEATATAYINTFVNRVEGNIIASQRPLIFQGPIGQAIGLFQSYQFNLLQQLFRYVAEGPKKDLAMLLGLQSTLYGMQSLPAFQFINTHILGQLSGNLEHRDTYDAVYGATGRTAGDFILYGIPSNILQTNIYSRGDINPRQITILPTALQEIPIVAGWGKFLLNLKDTLGKISGGGNVWESLLQGIEHNGISRPLAGFAQVLQGVPNGEVYSTSSKGSILYSNDLFSLASLSRIAGGKPLDEAIVNDAMFRVRAYEASRRADMEKLAETVKTTLIKDEKGSEEQVAAFAKRYAELGGKQAGFNKWMMGLYKNANTSQAEQLEMNLKSPFAYKMQLLMGGVDE